MSTLTAQEAAVQQNLTDHATEILAEQFGGFTRLFGLDGAQYRLFLVDRETNFDLETGLQVDELTWEVRDAKDAFLGRWTIAVNVWKEEK